jgi:hypothetical protein
MRPTVKQVLARLRAAARKSPDLVHRAWRDGRAPLAVLCYPLCECLAHLFPGTFEPWRISWPRGGSHWFLRWTDTGRVLDPNARLTRATYALGKRVHFLTARPSRRARVLAERAGLTLPS